MYIYIYIYIHINFHRRISSPFAPQPMNVKEKHRVPKCVVRLTMNLLQVIWRSLHRPPNPSSQMMPMMQALASACIAPDRLVSFSDTAS